jgi:predicted transcriptional regulator YdeE
MEIYNLKEDVKVFCTTAKSFPDGVQEAFITLEKMLSKEGRTFYGISHGSKDGGIIYKAAVSESFEGEAEKYGFETIIIKKGEYITETITDWRKKMQAFGPTFKRLLSHPLFDKISPCIEWYKSDKEVVCMVKADQSII